MGKDEDGAKLDTARVGGTLLFVHDVGTIALASVILYQ